MFLARKFIGGFTPEELRETVRRLKKEQSMLPILDYAVERSMNTKQHQKVIRAYLEDMPIDGEMVAVKASAFLVGDKFLHRKNLSHLVESLLQRNCTILLDAEEAELNARVNNHFNDLIRRLNVPGDIRVYKTYQMVHQITEDQIKRDLENHSAVGIKLVRGAYLHVDQRHPVYQKNIHGSLQETHMAYDRTMKDLIHYQLTDPRHVQVMFATHNARSLQTLLHWIAPHQRNRFRVAQLLGMADAQSNVMRAAGFQVYKYVPYGPFKECLPYLFRRLLENKFLTRHML